MGRGGTPVEVPASSLSPKVGSDGKVPSEPKSKKSIMIDVSSLDESMIN